MFKHITLVAAFLACFNLNAYESKTKKYNVKWNFNTNTTLNAAYQSAKKQGRKFIDLEIRNLSPLKVSVISANLESGQDKKSWNFTFDSNTTRLNNLLKIQKGFVTDLEVYKRNGKWQLMAIYQKKSNPNQKGYWYNFDLTFEALKKQINTKGGRVIDIDTYTKNNKRYYSVVAIPNPTNKKWGYLINVTTKRMKEVISGRGMQLIDLERHPNGNVSVVYVKNPSVPDFYYTNIDSSDIKNYYKHNDGRIIDIETFKKNGKQRFAMLVAKNTSDIFHSKHSEVRKAVNDHMGDNKLVGVAVAVVKNGNFVYKGGFGYSNKEKKFRVSPNNTMFRWASVSKTIAGTLSAKLRTRNVFKYKEPISTYYPAYDTPSYHSSVGSTRSPRAMTLDLLLSNQGGIQHYDNNTGDLVPSKARRNNPAINRGLEWAVKKWWEYPLIARQNTYSYSTFGFNLAGVVMEKAYRKKTGQTRSFAQLTKAFISNPLKLTTLQPDYYWVNIPYRAKGYKGESMSVETDNSDVSYKLPGGGFISNVKDFCMYGKGLVGNFLTQTEKDYVWDKRAANGDTFYGYGFSVNNNQSRAWHTGSQPKTNTLLSLFIKEGSAICIMTNTRHDNTDLWGLRDSLRDIFWP